MEQVIKELLEKYNKEQLKRALKEMSSDSSDESSTAEDF